MKIALCGSASSSVRLAPYQDPTWRIWGCSPALYPIAGRVDEWFELHFYEPPVLGRIDKQVPWLTPEYCGWMALQNVVWMKHKQESIPGSRDFPWEKLVKRYGPYFFTSSLSWMAAFAIERILLKREHPETRDKTEDCIGFWGVDMAAAEEYGYQKAGCQYFTLVARSLGIRVVTPPESDLLRPPPLYGIDEDLHQNIKWRAKRKELEAHRHVADENAVLAQRNKTYFDGALDLLRYMQENWGTTQPADLIPELVLGNLPGPKNLEAVVRVDDNYDENIRRLRSITGGTEEAPTGTDP